MKTTAIASVLALAMMTGPVMAQEDADTSSPQQQMQMNGKMMAGNGQAMNDDGMKQGGMGCMKMQGRGGRGMMGGMMKNMSAENQQKFLDATKEMRKEMNSMRFDHMEAMRNPKTTPEDLTVMEQKMLDTRKEMMKIAKTFQAQKN
jgi:hypothetical protein